MTERNAQGADREDGEIPEGYDHDMSAQSMTVCGVGGKVVSRLRDDRLADRVSGRLALRQAYADLRQRHTAPVPHPAIAYRPDGRPYLPAQPGLHCSISHSHRFGVAAVAVAPVGIDIEKIRPRDPRLLDYIAEESETAALRRLVVDDTGLLTLIWTLKEATAKACGLGLSVALRRLRVTASGTHTFEIDGWKAVSYRYEQFFVGLAFQQNGHGRPPIRWYQPRGLPATGVAQDAVGIEAIEAGSLQRQVSS